ncbi:DinB family protein [Streptomyces sp. RG80]|uniref:DinB family protein n=1 Tax=Streptomyces sp. RG80 TaxID=3157340 RepID=UPI00338FCAA7
MQSTTRSRSPLGPTPPPTPDCRHCGFTTALNSPDALPETLLEYTTGWQRLLRDPGHDHRRSGLPAWSPLEQGCHVRDMCQLFHLRLDAILGPSPIAPRSPAEALPDTPRRYRDEEPHRVADELRQAAEALARRLATLTAADWDRDDPRLADPRLTVGFFTRHLLHDIAHDLAEALRVRGDCGTTHQRTGDFHG